MLRRALLAVLVLGAVLRLVSPSLDPAATLFSDLTDEGWWAASAARAARGGALVQPDDYNPVFVTPVWTLLLRAAFAVAGPSLATARVVAGLCGALVPALIWWAFAGELDERERALAAALASLSFVAIAFSRMAILEAPLALALVHAVGWHRRAVAGQPGAAPAAALAMALAVLTKTSALALVPVLVLDALLAGSRAAAAAALAGAAAFPLFGAAAAAAHPAEWAMMVGLNVGDKVPHVAAIPAQVLWYLGFDQLLSDAPVVVLGAWTAAIAVVAGLRARPRDAAPFVALWFLAMAAAVAILPYQPKRYHMLTFPPACVLTAILCVRAADGAWRRAPIAAGATAAAVMLGFAMAMSRMRAAGQFIAQTSLHPDNARQLLRDGSLASAALIAAVWVCAVRVKRPVRWSAVAGALLALELTVSLAAGTRWWLHATNGAQRAAIEIAAAVRARPPSRLAGSAAHTVALETGIDTRWLSIDPRFARRTVPADPISHVLLDDARDLEVWRREVPALVARMQPAGAWTLTPDWDPPTRWLLFEVAPAR